MNQKTDFTTAVVDLTDRCNDRCHFCFNSDFLGSGSELTLAEIKQKFAAADQKFGIDQVIISGGEPTLHSQFFEIFDFFLNETDAFISLNTNSLLFAESDFRGRVLTALQSTQKTRKKFSLSFSNVDHWPAQTVREKQKVEGTKQAIATAFAGGASLVTVLAITRQNYKILPQLTDFLLAQATQPMTFSLRGLYLAGSMTDEQKRKCVPPSWSDIRDLVVKSLRELIKNKNAKIRLFGLPLCYLADEPDLIDAVVARAEPWWHERRIKIRKGVPLKARLFQEEVWQPLSCQRCILNPACNKIQPEFLEKYDYPPFRPF